MKKVLIPLLLLIPVLLAAQSKVTVSHALAQRGTPKYPATFKNFEYVNPNAPTGGMLVMHAIGTYDNFNRFASRGSAAAASTAFYDTLMTASEDEASVLYGLVAQKVEYPEDNTWIIFHINPAARFQDGKPITASDIEFSFNKFKQQGITAYRTLLSKVEKVEVLDKLRIRYTLKEGDRDMLLTLASMTILPRQYWENRNLEEPLTEIPLGSGAYTVKDYKIGQYVVYDLIENYWAKDHPVIKGQLTFQKTRFDYYRDQTVALEAFKAGEFDIMQETSAKNWATMYTGPAFDNKYILKETIQNEIPEGMQGFAFNTEREIFKDRRVRTALSYMMDFEWMNANLFYGQYVRARSYFQNTQYAATGLPSAAELKILEPIRSQIPPEVFTKEFNMPKSDGTGTLRTEIRAALALLKEAGWELKDRRLVNVKTGQPMEFEIILSSPSDERYTIPYQKNLEKIGVTMNIRTIDTTQWINRARDRDYDMITSLYSAYFFPESFLLYEWHTDYLDSTYNSAGVQDKAVDYLVEGIVANQNDEQALLAWGRALDRVLTWNFYVVPQWYYSAFRVAYWNKFSMPAIRPKYSLGTGTWWLDKAKEARLPRR